MAASSFSSSSSRLLGLLWVVFVVIGTRSWAAVEAKKDSGCEALPTTKNDENLFNFDCSESNLTWDTFPNHVMWSVHYSTDLNLASNAFDPQRHTIYDGSFHVFEKLVGVLNLSSNQFEFVQEHAFFYETTAAGPSLRPLKIVELDLSHNNFKSVPWNSLKYLANLRKLSFSSNPIRQLSTGEYAASISPKYQPSPQAVQESAGSSFFFSNLLELDLSNCQIDYVEPAMVDHLKRLQVLNLSSNRLRALSFQVALALLQAQAPGDQKAGGVAKTGFRYLNVRKNPLECDCKLLWLKKFLINYQRDSEATCRMNVTVAMAVTSKSAEVAERLAGGDGGGGDQTAAKRPRSYPKLDMSIIAIEDEQFVCDLDLYNTLGIKNYSSSSSDKQRTLKCHVLTYPRANIWWTYGSNRVLSKTTFSDPLKQVVETSDKYAIFDAIAGSNLSSTSGVYVQDAYRIESTLVLKDLDTFDSNEFSCHVSHDLYHYKARKFFQDGQEIRDLLIMDPVDSQSNPIAIVRDLVPQKAIKFLVKSESPLTTLERIFGYDRRGDAETPHGVSGQAGKTNIIYWIILGLCIIFSIVVAIFVLICILRHRRNVKKEEMLYMSSSTGGGGDYSANYSSYDWKSNSKSSSKQRSPNTLSTFNDLEATMPLKPDVIRRHIDYSPVYNEADDDEHYDMTPSPTAPHHSLRPQHPVYASPFQTPVYQNVPRRNNAEQSFDNDPVDASIMYENDPNTISLSSKSSFDENIEEYQDPKMGIDLSKPVPRLHKIY